MDTRATNGAGMEPALRGTWGPCRNVHLEGVGEHRRRQARPKRALATLEDTRTTACLTAPGQAIRAANRGREDMNGWTDFGGRLREARCELPGGTLIGGRSLGEVERGLEIVDAEQEPSLVADLESLEPFGPGKDASALLITQQLGVVDLLRDSWIKSMEEQVLKGVQLSLRNRQLTGIMAEPLTGEQPGKRARHKHSVRT